MHPYQMLVANAGRCKAHQCSAELWSGNPACQMHVRMSGQSLSLYKGLTWAQVVSAFIYLIEDTKRNGTVLLLHGVLGKVFEWQQPRGNLKPVNVPGMSGVPSTHCMLCVRYKARMRSMSCLTTDPYEPDRLSDGFTCTGLLPEAQLRSLQELAHWATTGVPQHYRSVQVHRWMHTAAMLSHRCSAPCGSSAFPFSTGCTSSGICRFAC